MQGKLVRRSACVYWFWALLAVVLYPLWGLSMCFNKVLIELSLPLMKCICVTCGDGCKAAVGCILTLPLFLSFY